MVPRRDLIMHLSNPGKKYEECRAAWKAANNEPVTARPYHPGSGKLALGDDPFGVWMCPGLCAKETYNSKESEEDKKLWGKESIKKHWNGTKRKKGVGRRSDSDPCQKYQEWKLQNPDKVWDGTVWRCSCHHHFPKCNQDDIANHVEKCAKYMAYEQGEPGSKGHVILPTFSYTPLRKCKYTLP